MMDRRGIRDEGTSRAVTVVNRKIGVLLRRRQCFPTPAAGVAVAVLAGLSVDGLGAGFRIEKHLRRSWRHRNQQLQDHGYFQAGRWLLVTATCAHSVLP